MATAIQEVERDDEDEVTTPSSPSMTPPARAKRARTAKRGTSKRTPRKGSAPAEPVGGGEGRSERKKNAPAISYPPYVNAYGAIPKLFERIKGASVPPKFTQDFLASVLGLKTSSHRALIPLLKRLGFLDQANVPTAQYRAVRDPDTSEHVMAEQLRQAYADLYLANEYAHTLSRPEIVTKLRSVLGAASDDPVITAVAATFQELAKLADFEAPSPNRHGARRSRARTQADMRDDSDDADAGASSAGSNSRTTTREFGLSYTINLNLPATADINVFNAIFRSLREHILADG